MCSAFLHIPLKPIQVESSSHKTSPSGISLCFQMLIIIPETFIQWCWMLEKQTRDIKNGVKSKGGHRNLAKGTRVPENDKWVSYLGRSRTILETPWIEARSALVQYTRLVVSQRRLGALPNHKSRGEDTEGWKAKNLQTLSAAGATFSAHSKAFDDSIINIESLTTYTFIHVFLNIHLSHPLKS